MKVYVAGHTGLVGSAVVRALRGHDLVLARHAQLDLTRQAETEAFLVKHRPDAVVLAAARVGGIGGQPHAEMLHDNLAIAHHVIDGARRAGCKRLVFLGSSCIYPRFAPQPITEDALLTGPLEPTNRGYAVAKIAGMEMARAYAAAGLLECVSLMPTNLYGPGDNYDLQRSHVLPAMIRRFHEAKVANVPSVTMWGSGAALREFLHADDLAQAVLMALGGSPGADPINVGSGVEVTIRQLAEMISRAVGYEGEIAWDTSKPDGTPRKLLDSSRMRALGWQPRIALEDGIRSTYAAWQTQPLVKTSSPAPGTPVVVASASLARPPIIALTSLSPDPSRAARQRKCAASWLANGCDRVLAFQTAAEIAQLGAWEGVEFVAVEPSAEWSGRFIPISRVGQWAVKHAVTAKEVAGHILIINGDIELECHVRTFADQVGAGLCYLVRHETDGSRCISGVDAFLMKATSAAVIPRSEALCFGLPYWDYTTPLAFVHAGLPVCSPRLRVMNHEPHPPRASGEEYKRTAAEAARLFGRPIAYNDFASKTRPIDGGVASPAPPLPAWMIMG